MDEARTPFVAAIHGFCLGGGLELAMCCDIRVASEDAQLGQPEIKLGLIPGGGGTQRLPRLVGLGRALLLNLTGDFIDAATAYDWGLVEKVVPREELLDAATGSRPTIAARSPVAVGVLRELARTTRDLPLEEGLRREADGFRRCLASEDGAGGRGRVPREARAAVHGGVLMQPSRSVHASSACCADEGGRARARRRAGAARRRGRAGAGARKRQRRPGPRRGDQLRGRPDPARAVPADAAAPAVLGSEVAGELDGRPRARASCAATGGGYAERAAVDRRWLFPLPDERELRGGRRFADGVPHGLDPADASRSAIASGARVLVTAAAGGVGTAAVQLVARAQRRPLSRRSAARRSTSCRARSARRRPSRTSELGELEPVDVVFDLVGGDVFASSLALLKPLGTAIAVGLRGRALAATSSPARLVGRNIGVHGFYLGRLIGREPGRSSSAAARTCCGSGKAASCSRSSAPSSRSSEAGEAHRLIEERSRPERWCSSRDGARHRVRGRDRQRDRGQLRAEGFEVEELDLVDGFDVTDPDAWEHVGSVDLACLNAGVLTGAATQRS